MVDAVGKIIAVEPRFKLRLFLDLTSDLVFHPYKVGK